MTFQPELLSPAGDFECLRAAVESGADAVYFGLRGHNARARAHNFALDEAGSALDFLHARGVRGYVTLNTLAFSSELEEIETIVRRLAEQGADALIVQDLGLAKLIRETAPAIEIHASTQMSITNRQGLTLARDLGCSRAILARELSLDEIEKLQSDPVLPIEVFVHGALCVAYSGQCLTSEALGQRSANRGECAQACRLAYEMTCDGVPVDLGDRGYLLSPRDLAAFDLVPRLIELGVASLKIEGRLKTPEYVANITSAYRSAIDHALDGRPKRWTHSEIQDMEMSFSRGFSHGFLDGPNHKILVRGDYSKKKGVHLGFVTAVLGDRVRVQVDAPPKPGDGVAFDAELAADAPEQGGRVYDVQPAGPGLFDLAFGRRDLDLSRLAVGQKLWKTDDPELNARLRAGFSGPPRRKLPLDVVVRAVVGRPLEIELEAPLPLRVQADQPLETAATSPADRNSLFEQFDRLGGSARSVRSFRAEVEGAPFVPASLMNRLRRELIDSLDQKLTQPPAPSLSPEPVLPQRAASLAAARARAPRPAAAELFALCRTPEQAIAAAEAEVKTIYLEFQDISKYEDTVARVKRTGASVFVATLRIEKPGEEGLLKRLGRLGADGLLVRNASGIEFCRASGIPFVVDFAMNAANPLTVDLFKGHGALRVTASYDLNATQLEDLLKAVPPHWLEIVIHQHVPMFHMEHCVYCAFLSPGTDHTNCGRPCDVHDVTLRDRVGAKHPLRADIACRNTLYAAMAQTAAQSLPGFMKLGARAFRIELLNETQGRALETINLYRDLISGRRAPGDLFRALKAVNRYGITSGEPAGPAPEVVAITPLPKR